MGFRDGESYVKSLSTKFQYKSYIVSFFSFLLQVYVCDFQKKKKNHDT